jgi:hypothetical protein
MDWNSVLNAAIYGGIIGAAGGILATVLGLIVSPMLPEAARRQFRGVLLLVIVIGGGVVLTPIAQEKFGPIIARSAPAAQP